MTGRPMNYRFMGWSGRSFWRNWFSEKRQARWVACWLLGSIWKDADPAVTPLYLIMPLQTYRIVDSSGKVEVVQGDAMMRLV